MRERISQHQRTHHARFKKIKALATHDDRPRHLSLPQCEIYFHDAVGTKVKRGEALMVMEAMKMEHTISAPAAGLVKEVFFAVGDQVTDGASLISVE